MRKILVLLLIACQASMAQSLSGTIKYDVKIDIPEKNKQEMQKYGIAMPTGMELSTNGTNAKMKMTSSAGTMMEVLHTVKESYFLDSKNKKAYKLPENMGPQGQGPKPTVTKTEEFETIAGHKCRKYIIEKGGSKEFVWATADYKISPAMLASLSRRGPGGDNSYMKEIEGIPLKMITNERGNKMEMTAVSISESAPSEKDLSVPSDYTVEPFSPAVMGMMMGGAAGGPPKKD
jgi:hypothetical protein